MSSLSATLSKTLASAVVTAAALSGCGMMCRACKAKCGACGAKKK